jgi:ribosomal protein S18 acetylase RimI-like enzyme
LNDEEQFEKLVSNEHYFHELFSDKTVGKSFTLYYNSNFADDPIFNHAVLKANSRSENSEEILASIRSAAEKTEVPASIFVDKYASWAESFEKAAMEIGYRVADTMTVLSKPLEKRSTSRVDSRIVSFTTKDFELWNDIFMRSFRIGISWKNELLRREAMFLNDRRVTLFLAGEDGSGFPASGCLLLAITPDDCSGIYSVGTLPERRGRGVARSMMDAAEAYASNRGCKTVTLQTLNSDDVAPMYLKMGYRVDFLRDILQFA